MTKALTSRLVLAALAAGMTVAATTPAQACAVCFGAPGSDVNQAMGMAIFLMLGVLAVVLGSFIGFFFYLRKRASAPLPDYVELADLAAPDTSKPQP